MQKCGILQKIYRWGLYFEEGSNASIFCASIMPLFFKTLITQDLKLKSQNKIEMS